MLGKKGKAMSELIDKQAAEIESLKEELVRVQSELVLYKQKENAIINALTEAQASAMRIEQEAKTAALEAESSAQKQADAIIAEAEAKVSVLLSEAELERELASEEADKLLAEAKAISQELLSDSRNKADELIRSANAKASETLEGANIALEDYKRNIKALNVLLENAALDALEASEKFAAYVSEIKADSDSDYAEETLPKLIKNDAVTPEEYSSPAQLMQSIYALQGRDIPSTEDVYDEPAQTNKVKLDSNVEDDIEKTSVIHMTDCTDEELSALIDDVLGD
ncbi:MAG: hypothetical protein IJA35_00980 [Clostridia bacterium]|nr:hypothetical protein [Clostridia bacterium]